MGWQDAPEAETEPAPAASGWQSAPVEQDNTKPTYSGSILPFSRYPDGSVAFDSNAGVVGDVKRAFTGLPALAHQVGNETAANTATPGTAGQVANLAAMAAPTGELQGASRMGTAAERAAVDTPTTQELYDSAGQRYNIGRQYGKYFDYDPSYVADLANGVQSGLNQDGMHPMLAPQSHAILSDLQNPQNGAVLPFTGVEAARRTFNNIAQGNNPTDAAAAKRAVSALTDFMENPPAEAIIPGSSGPFAAQAAADKAGDLYTQARGDYAAAKRSDKVEGAGDYAKFRAASANSGNNLDNSIRQQVRPLLDPRQTDRRLAGFTPDERQAVEGVVSGSGPRNFLRTTGNVLGGGGGLGRLTAGAVGANVGAGAGYMAAGPIGSAVGSTLGATVLPSIGSAARAGANSLAQKDLAAAAETIRQRSPLFQERQAAAPMTVPTNAAGKAAEGAALGAGTTDNQPAYAKGGAVKKPTHEFLVQRLMKLAEKAKRAEKKVTKPILSMNDDTVTAALAKAQAAI